MADCAERRSNENVDPSGIEAASHAMDAVPRNGRKRQKSPSSASGQAERGHEPSAHVDSREIGHCARPNCTQPAHPLDAYCSRLCHEVHIGRQPETAIAEHAKWLRNHRAGGNPKSATNVNANIANARAQGAATWASE